MMDDVRLASPADAQAIADLIAEHVRRAQVLPRSLEEIEATIQNWMVSVKSGRIVACGSLLFYSPTVAEVRSLVVDDSHKGNGVGSALLRSLIDLAKQRNIPTLFALTRAVPLFDKQGFQMCDKGRFPEKIWRDCMHCPTKDQCDETAVVLYLSENPIHYSLEGELNVC
jgi:amino-acid N-acetyltransferase